MRVRHGKGAYLVSAVDYRDTPFPARHPLRLLQRGLPAIKCDTSRWELPMGACIWRVFAQELSKEGLAVELHDFFSARNGP